MISKLKEKVPNERAEMARFPARKMQSVLRHGILCNPNHNFTAQEVKKNEVTKKTENRAWELVRDYHKCM